MKKKIFIVIGIILITIIVLGIITNYVDSGRVATGHEPKCCIKIISKDGSKVTYWGLGYKVIRYVGVSPNEPYKNNIGVKMGNWFMKYELPIDSEHNKEGNISIKNLDDFYNTKLTKEKDIRNLSKEYSSFDAQKDNCFVVGAMVHNDYLYNQFMEDYQNKKTSFIRVAQNTVEGDLILNDILYYDKADKIYLVTDNTRDKFSSNENRTIEFMEYEHIGKWKYLENLYWVVYNGELEENPSQEYTINPEKLYIIAIIN